MRLHRPKRVVGYGGKFLIKDEEDQVAFILRVVEKSSEPDVGAPGDLAKRGGFVSMLGEEFARGSTDALAFVQFILFPESKLRRYGHSL